MMHLAIYQHIYILYIMCDNVRILQMYNKCEGIETSTTVAITATMRRRSKTVQDQ